jgi:PAS domain S-box-containing protein
VAPGFTGRPVPGRSLSERFLELTTDVAGAIGFDGRLVAANPALKRLIGTEVGELARPNAATLLHPDDRAPLRERWAALVGGDRTTAEIEVRLGMRARWFLLSLVVDRDAELVYIIGKDVHESRESGERLTDAEARFRGAFESSAIGMTITGLDRRFARVNEAFARLVGRSVEELTGAPVAGVSHPDEPTRTASSSPSCWPTPAASSSARSATSAPTAPRCSRSSASPPSPAPPARRST